MFESSISGEHLEALPLKIFEGEIVVVDDAQLATEAAKYLRSQPVIGFDTETRPTFTKGMKNKVALIQLATIDRAYLFRINKIGLPLPVKELLENKNIIKVGAAIHEDLRGLQRIEKFIPQSFVDLQAVAKQQGITDMSVRKLTGLLLSFRISKSQQLSNWESDVYTEPQMRYAATDAWVCLLMYDTLKNNH